MKSVRKVTRRSPQLDSSNRENMYYPTNKRCMCNASTGIHTYGAATPLRSVDEYADEDGNVSMKIRQRFRDTDEIRSRRRVILTALPHHGEEGPREVVLARGTSTS